MSSDDINRFRCAEPDENDRCGCESITGIVLCYALTENPFTCLVCRDEVDLEKLTGIDGRLLFDIFRWRQVFSALYHLWLDSSEYESWAKSRLTDKAGQVHQAGLEVTRRLCAYYPTYYLWFHDSDDGVLENCPRCDLALTAHSEWRNGCCEPCKIAV